VADRRNTPPHRAVANAGYAFAILGLIGLLVAPHLYILWAFLIFFGLAALPRALIEWLRDRKR
jgi:hypothetical protein